MIDSGLIPDEEDTPSLVSASQLAVWLRVSTRTVQNWTRAGILPKPVMLSPRKIFYRTEAVRRAIQAIEEDRWTTAVEDGNGKTN